MMNEQKQTGMTLRFAEQDGSPSHQIEASFLIKQRKFLGSLSQKEMTFNQYMAFKDSIFETVSRLSDYPTASSNYINCLALYQLGNDKISFTPEQRRDWKAFSRKVPEVLEPELAKSPAALEYVQMLKKAPLDAYVFQDENEKVRIQEILQNYTMPVVFLEKDVRTTDDSAMLHRAMLMTLSLNPAIQFDTRNVSLTLELNNKLQADNLRLKELHQSFIESAAESRLYPQLAADIGVILPAMAQKRESSPISLGSSSSTTELEQWDRDIEDLTESTLDLSAEHSSDDSSNNLLTVSPLSMPKDKMIGHGLFSRSPLSAHRSEKLLLTENQPQENPSESSCAQKPKSFSEQKKAMEALSRPRVRVLSVNKSESGLFCEKGKSPIERNKLQQAAAMERLSTGRGQRNGAEKGNTSLGNTTRPKKIRR